MRDSTALKGLAIAAIVFHNFFHFVSPAHQNEFTFDPARLGVFFRTVIHPSLAIQAFFAFFGHFGVQMFIFLSAYGLARSHWDDPSSWAGFLWGRVKKLYPAFGLVVVAWFAADIAMQGSIHYAVHIGVELLMMFLGVSTVLGYGLPPVGPWWFIPFIVQFYALWLPLRWMTKRFGWPSLVLLSAVCVTVSYLMQPWLLHWRLDLFLTPIGRMPVLCLGILAARYPIRLRAWMALLGAAVMLLGSRFAPLWPLTFPAAAFLFLWMYLQTRGLLRRSSLLQRMGEYSLLVFLLNGVVRVFFIPYAKGPASQLILGLASAAAAFGIAALIQEFVIGPEPPRAAQLHLA